MFGAAVKAAVSQNTAHGADLQTHSCSHFSSSVSHTHRHVSSFASVSGFHGFVQRGAERGRNRQVFNPWCKDLHFCFLSHLGLCNSRQAHLLLVFPPDFLIADIDFSFLPGLLSLKQDQDEVVTQVLKKEFNSLVLRSVGDYRGRQRNACCDAVSLSLSPLPLESGLRWDREWKMNRLSFCLVPRWLLPDDAPRVPRGIFFCFFFFPAVTISRPSCNTNLSLTLQQARGQTDRE